MSLVISYNRIKFHVETYNLEVFTCPSMIDDFQVPLPIQDAWTVLRESNAQDAHDSYKIVSLLIEVPAYQAS
jgi:hypothetical protein